MSKFGDLAKKAESYAEEHPQEAGKGIQEADDFANRETGDKYQNEIQDATGAAERHFGQGSGQQQGSQNQGEYQQDQGGYQDGGQDQGGQDQGGAQPGQAGYQQDQGGYQGSQDEARY